MWKAILLGTLSLSLLVELVMTAAAFASPAMLLEQFRIGVDPGTLFLCHVVAWFLLLVDGLIGFALVKIRRGEAVGWTAAYFIGGWWILLGLSIYLVHGRPDNLLLDSLKGLLIVVAAYRTRRAA